MKITGLSSRIAALSRPFPSAGVDGQATSRPGIWRNRASKLCEWVGPSWCPPPLPELVEQALGDLEGPLEDADVLAHHEDVLVAPHFLGHRVAQRLAHPHDSHQWTSSGRASGWSPSASRSSC